MFFIVVEHVRLGPQGNRPVKVSKPKVFITTGADVSLKGMCLMFNRVRPQNEVTEENISQVLLSLTKYQDALFSGSLSF